MLSLFRVVALSTLAATVAWHSPTLAQEKVPRSILSIETDGAAATDMAPKPAITLISSGKSSLRASKPSNTEAEVIRDRYPNGKLRVERTVVLDGEGNYVNAGDYREYSEKGDLLVTGTYDMGQRQGVWARFLYPNDAKLLTSYPINKFRPPFSSSVEFHNDKMHGVWVISDRDKRIAMQLELHEGQRHGTMTLYHSNGQIFAQSQFNHGLLDGARIEKNVDGKLVVEELYSAGQKVVVDTEHYPNKHVKSVMRYLASTAKVVAADDWATTTLASYSNASEQLQHGEFVTYHDNGQVATKGSYEQGKLHGQFQSWHRTGEVASLGSYEHGQQVGPWMWRHANGMKKATATYVAGKPEGDLRSWDETGKAIVR